jgi:hypothetical protein
MGIKIAGVILGLVLTLPLYTVIQLRRAGLGFDSTADAIGTWVIISLGLAMIAASIFCK